MSFYSTAGTARPPLKSTPTKLTPIKVTPPRQTPIKPLRS
jgi:hypothetical protein